jgi:hypothetical protein
MPSLSSPIDTFNVASHPSLPCFNSTSCCPVSLLLLDFIFPLISFFNMVVIFSLTGFVFHMRLVHHVAHCFRLFFLFFFYCVVGGRLSLYSFIRLPLIIPLRSEPTRSLKCTYPLSVTAFTSYGPSHAFSSFLGAATFYCRRVILDLLH